MPSGCANGHLYLLYYMTAKGKQRELPRPTVEETAVHQDVQRELTNNKFISDNAIPLTDCNKQEKSLVCYTEN